MVAPSQRRQAPNNGDTHSFEVHRQGGPSLGRLTLPCIKDLIAAGLLTGEDMVEDPKAGPLCLRAWEPVQSVLQHAPQAATPSPPRPTLVEASYDPDEDPDLLGEYSIDVDGPIVDGISVDLETLVEDARARISGETPAPLTSSASPTMVLNGEWADFDPDEASAPLAPDTNAEWSDFDPYAEGLVPSESPQGPARPDAPHRQDSAARAQSRSSPAAQAARRARRARTLAPVRDPIATVAAVLLLSVAAIFAIPLAKGASALGPSVPMLLLLQMLAIAAAGIALLVVLRNSSQAAEGQAPPLVGLHLLATIVVGLLLGSALPSLGLQAHRGPALMVRLGLAVSVELVFRGSFDPWLARVLRSRMRTTMISGVLFALIYAGTLMPWVDASAQLWGSALVMGVFLAWGGVATRSLKLVTWCHIIAAVSAAVISS